MKEKMSEEIRAHLQEKMIPFWKKLKDARGGYYGYVGYDLAIDEKAEKGCILNSRILWFFAAAAIDVDPSLKEYAEHAWLFLRDYFWDREYGGLYWSVTADGDPLDDSKHTYNQAFAVYALAKWYECSHEEEARKLAMDLFDHIENNMRDDEGYLEAFDRSFQPVTNEKLSENGVEAARTMNTLLHVMEAYTELYRVSGEEKVREKLVSTLEIFEKKIYSQEKKRLLVFFDRDYRSLIDLYSYGHDIEAAWLLNRTTEVLGDPEWKKRIDPITAQLTASVYKEAFDSRSIPGEAENGVVLEDRIWWVQAEGINGFLDAYQRDPSHTEYLQAAESIWGFIKEYLIDPREGSEWFDHTDAKGAPAALPFVQPWKCPYHNGRMCLEVLRK